jgi:hypothetical protein
MRRQGDGEKNNDWRRFVPLSAVMVEVVASRRPKADASDHR